MNVEQARFNMIEQQIRPWDVLDQSVLSLLAVVKREDFVPTKYRAAALMDLEVPLPGGQVMLAPRVEARLLQELGLQRHEKVLEIGTGSGFMAALLAHRAQQVVTLDCRPELARLARENLRRQGLLNVSVVEVTPEQGARGLPAEGPFDAILLSGSVAEIPRVLLEQLKVGGRLVAIVGREPVMSAQVVTRAGDGAWNTRSAFETLAPRLQGFAEKPAFVF